MTQFIGGGGSEYSSEEGQMVWVGTWLQLIIAPPRLYIGDCPSISEGKVGGSEVGRRFGGLEVSSEKSEEYQRSPLKMTVEGNFQIRERRLHYMSFILLSKISIRVVSA